MKTIMDHFNERHWEDFRNSSLGYLADVLDIQFFAQLIQQLVFRTIRTDNLYELWFSVRGHLMRFDLQEYALVTGLRCGAFLEGAEFDRLLERRRLKERRLLHGFRGTWAKKFQKAKRRKEKKITYTVHGFPIAMQVWAYEALPEVGEHFAERLHVYATLRPTDVEAQQPYFLTLVPYDEPPISILDDIARTVVAPQFNASGGDDRDGGHATREDSEEEASEGGRKQWSTTQARTVGTAAPDLSRGDVEELLLDQKILFEMQLRTVKLEIQQHVTSECTSFREFLGTLVARAGPTTTEPEMRAETEVGVLGSLPEDVFGGPAEPCPYESDIAIDAGNMQDAAHIAPSQDDLNLPVPAASEEVQDTGATELSNDAGDDDEEADGCDATDDDGVVTEVPAPESVPEA
ncbi:Hypothetical predicted protein [Olea europaea subsp. europaea]|uniref:DUF1985 domain-containing protein n=1 Tax=Olea europaea subsp. europaea TaxID=158383 RepID=A0A8S0S4R2_OLEEU|nr:Hypothetical predicted protein [Olea europaea subsp. europaea]